MKNRPHDQVRTVKSNVNHSTNTATAKQTLVINSDKQYRLVLAVLERAMGTNDLIRIVGANNVPDVVMRLRAKGWIIPATFAPVYNRDGLKVDAGSYQLDHAQHDVAKVALKAYQSKCSAKAVQL
jgi:hypothetical protein